MKKFKELDINEQHREKGRFKPTIPRIVPNVAGATTRNTSDSAEVKLKEAATGDTSTFDTPVGNQFRQGDSPAARSMLEKPQKEPMKKYKEVKEDSDIDLEKDAPSVEAIAKKHGVSVDEIEKQLKIGMSVEAEHGKNKGSEREIAMDHLNEKPDYYTKLKKYVEETEVNEMLKPKMSSLDKWRQASSEREKKHNEIASKQSKEGSGMTSAIDRLSKQLNKEETEQLEEGRPSQRHPLEGHEYHRKTNAELEYIAKDAHKAAEAMKSHNTTAENKYRDQANDSATVRHFRKTSGSPDWYKKKYNLKEETEMENTIEEGAVPSTEKTVALRHKSSGKEIRVTQNSIRAYRSLGYHPIREESELTEGQNKQVEGGDPCWKNYEMVGKKMKNGKEVPNCVPVKEAKDDDVGEMIKDKLKIIINRAQEMHDEIGDAEDMPEWVKSKVTLAQDYISTACDYSCGKEQLGEEMKKHPFVAVHAKKGKHETHGSTSYEAAQNAAKHWKMKNTAGIDVYRADKTHVAEEARLDEGFVDDIKQSFAKGMADKVKKAIPAQYHKHYDFDSIKSVNDTKEIVKKAKTAGHMKEDVEQIDESPKEGAKPKFSGMYNPAPKGTMAYDQQKKKAEYAKARAAGSSPKNARARAAGAENPHVFEETEQLDEAPVVIKTNKEIGAKVTSIGPGGKETTIKTDSAFERAKQGVAASRLEQQARKGTPVPAKEFAKGVLKDLKKVNVKEEVEELDELSKATLGAYVNKANAQQTVAGQGMQAHHGTYGDGDKKQFAKHQAVMHKRAIGLGKAVYRPTDKLTNEEQEIEEATIAGTTGWKKSPGTVTDKSGAKHSPMSRAKDLARLALSKKAKSLKPVKEEKEDSRKAEIVKDVVKSAKKKKSESTSAEKFESDPVLSSEIQKQ